MLPERKKILGYSNYEVSNTGEISSLTKTVQLTKHPVNGFLQVNLIDDNGEKATLYLHKIVAITFIKNKYPDSDKILLHINGDIYNNCSTNLIWTSYSEIIRSGLEINKQIDPLAGLDRDSQFEYCVEELRKKPVFSSLSIKQKQILRYLHEEGLSYTKLAVIFSRSTDTIYKTIKKMDKLCSTGN